MYFLQFEKLVSLRELSFKIKEPDKYTIIILKLRVQSRRRPHELTDTVHVLSNYTYVHHTVCLSKLEIVNRRATSKFT